MTRVHDDTRLAGAYHSGNAMPEASLRAWAEFVGSFAPRPAPAWLDVGAGTGMFCAALDRYQRASRVVGVEPSPAMLRAAREATAGGRARLVAGTAERLPLADGAFDIALLSRVVHHLPDRPAAARELARVLRPAGVVVLRTTFRERLDALVYAYWPRLRAIDGARFPGRAEVLADFAGAGFTARTVTSFAQPVAASLGEYAAGCATGRSRSSATCRRRSSRRALSACGRTPWRARTSRGAPCASAMTSPCWCAADLRPLFRAGAFPGGRGGASASGSVPAGLVRGVAGWCSSRAPGRAGGHGGT
ncbi:class I SAM-dependent methyltransferase [Streptomyces buecherae]|uniref:class I SAM-dependent methyltransferase n=1 Tax=Streptomyces buecherae TaxID=2763006 RepID=UPI003651361C